MAAARTWYIAASAIAVVAMVGRLGCTDRPGILHAAGAVATVLAIMLGVLLLIALLACFPIVILLAIAKGLDALFGGRKRRERTPPPVLISPPNGNMAS